MDNSVFYQNLEPFSFLERSAFVYPDKPAVIYKERVYTYSELRDRVNRLAGALKNAGIGRGDRVAFIVPNLPPLLEAHYGPMSIGAALVAINTRLSPREIAYILNHSRAKVLVFDSEFAPTVRQVQDEVPGISLYVQVVDEVPRADDIPGPEYEEFLSSAPDGEHRDPIASEMDIITINYTSGTTGMPKGVQYHARGAYLNALGEVIETGLNWRSVYLWTLPHVPLQRLVPHLGCYCRRGHARLPAPRRPRRGLPAHRAARRHQHVRRAHGAHGHVLLARRRGAGPLRPHHRHGRRAARPAGRPHDGGHGREHHPPLRPHRDLRPDHALRAPARLGRHDAGGARRSPRRSRACPTSTRAPASASWTSR